VRIPIPVSCSSPTRSTPLPGIGPMRHSSLTSPRNLPKTRALHEGKELESSAPRNTVHYQTNPRCRLFPAQACETNPTVPSASPPGFGFVLSFFIPRCRCSARRPGSARNPAQPFPMDIAMHRHAPFLDSL
jgi:hypothetical protein